jgi:hypothetical protein
VPIPCPNFMHHVPNTELPVVECEDDENDDNQYMMDASTDDDTISNDESSTEQSADDTDVSVIDDDESVVSITADELNDITNSISSEMSELQRELLMFHYKLKHMIFPDLRALAKRGIIPKRLAKVESPLCTACLFGKQHRKPWKGKRKKKNPIRKEHENYPGANASSDQMISPHPGLIPQSKGQPMKAKYYGLTVLVNHYSDKTYGHLMQDTTGKSTLEAKQAYERLAGTYGVKVRGYHADNGRYAKKIFIEDAKEKGQKLTFCGVGSHHQNGIAERRIKTITEDARTMLSHLMIQWHNSCI